MLATCLNTVTPWAPIKDIPDFAGLDINVTRQSVQDCHSVTAITGPSLCNAHFNLIIQDLVHQFYCLAGPGIQIRILRE